MADDFVLARIRTDETKLAPFAIRVVLIAFALRSGVRSVIAGESLGDQWFLVMIAGTGSAPLGAMVVAGEYE